jgi:hypothetical protein
MECRHILRKIIERGSDDLARAVYDRLRADRLAKPGAKGAQREPPAAPTWQALAARAVNERTVTPEEAFSLVQEADERLRVAGSRRLRMGLRNENRAG